MSTYLIKHTKTLLLAAAFACSAFAATTTFDHDEYHQKQRVATAKAADELVKGQHLQWWGSYKQSDMDIYVYIDQISPTQPKVAAWFLGGGLYGFDHTSTMTDENVKLWSSAMGKVAQAVSKLQRTGQFVNFFTEMESKHEQGRMYLDKLRNDVNALNEKVHNLEFRLDKLENERKADVLRLTNENNKLSLRITALENENKEFLKQLKTSEVAKAENAKIITEREEAKKTEIKHQQELASKNVELKEAREREKAAKEENKLLKKTETLQIEKATLSTEKNYLENSIKDKIENLNDFKLTIELLRATLGATNARVLQLEEKAQKDEKNILERQNLLKDLRLKLGNCDNCRIHINSIDDILLA